ncbi:hypothetical protein [Streptomyces sp. DG1A-41]|uniref:hypothetical protein n=1 Tax=Streptomyces sp. DG1A-41 TaxID=3125779 RepID=UPI0030D290F0
MAIDLKQKAIDPDIEIPPTRNTKEAVTAVLKDLQGNILKSHGRDPSRHLIITFKTDTPEQRGKARSFLTGLVEFNLVTSALQQWHEAQAHRDVKETIRGNGAIADEDVTALLKSVSETFVGVMLSADGYRALRLDEYMPDDPSFLVGAKAGVDVLKDAPVTRWEENFQGTLHAPVIVADDVTERLEVLPMGTPASSPTPPSPPGAFPPSGSRRCSTAPTPTASTCSSRCSGSTPSKRSCTRCRCRRWRWPSAAPPWSATGWPTSARG